MTGTTSCRARCARLISPILLSRSSRLSLIRRLPPCLEPGSATLRLACTAAQPDGRHGKVTFPLFRLHPLWSARWRAHISKRCPQIRRLQEHHPTPAHIMTVTRSGSRRLEACGRTAPGWRASQRSEPAPQAARAGMARGRTGRKAPASGRSTTHGRQAPACPGSGQGSQHRYPTSPAAVHHHLALP